MTMDQIEGNEPIHENFGTDLGEEIDEGGDPPRVWDATLEKPGVHLVVRLVMQWRRRLV